MTFEYKKVTIAADADHLKILQGSFDQGWELLACASVTKDNEQRIIFFLKRAKR